MTVTVLGQGFEATSGNAVGNNLIQFLADASFHSFHAITAFTSVTGVQGIQKQLENAKHLKHIVIITGVDQKSTSKEALQALMELEVDSYVFYVPVPLPIFHPKVYLFEGEKTSALIIGLTNLTANGLFRNVEASVLISIDNQEEADKKIVDDLKQYFGGLFTYDDPNLKPLTAELIAELVEAKIVLTEAERKELQASVEKVEGIEIQITAPQTFPKRAIPPIPKNFFPNKATGPKAKTKATTAVVAANLLWESGPLTERDLNIPKGKTTNPTGSMLFGKGKTKGIDQRHYFRNVVFQSLNWVFDTRKRVNPSGKSRLAR